MYGCSHRWLRVAYEDLVHHPEGVINTLCADLALPASCPDTIGHMCNPYTKENIRSFSSTTPGALAATDPVLLRRRHVDARQANAWRTTEVPRVTAAFTTHVAKMLGYALPMWKYPILGANASPAVVRLNACTALPSVDAGPLFVVQDIGGKTSPGMIPPSF
jgi:hypothetical protein